MTTKTPDYSPFPRPWTPETMTQLADYAEAGPALSAMERDLVEVVRLAAQTPEPEPTTEIWVCECGVHNNVVPLPRCWNCRMTRNVSASASVSPAPPDFEAVEQLVHDRVQAAIRAGAPFNKAALDSLRSGAFINTEQAENLNPSSSPAPPEEDKALGAGLIGQPIPTVAETELRPNRFRKKPVVVDAVQYVPGDGVRPGDVFEAHGMSWPVIFDGKAERQGPYISIKTLEGAMVAEYGDWIIKGIKGEFYPCKPDIFSALYDPAVGSVSVSTAERAVERAGAQRNNPNSQIASARVRDADPRDCRCQSFWDGVRCRLPRGHAAGCITNPGIDITDGYHGTPPLSEASGSAQSAAPSSPPRAGTVPRTGVNSDISPHIDSFPPVEEARERVLEANGQYKLAAFEQTVDDLIAAVRADASARREELETP